MKKNNTKNKSENPPNEDRLEWVNKLTKSVLESKEAEFKKIIENCNGDLKIGILSEVLFYFAINNMQESFDLVEKNCPDDLQLEMFVNGLINSIIENDEGAINMLKNADHTEEFKNEMFAEAMYFF